MFLICSDSIGSEKFSLDEEIDRLFFYDQIATRLKGILWNQWIGNPESFVFGEIQRINRAQEILQSGAILESYQFFQLGTIFQHGSEPSHFKKAQELYSISLRMGYSRAISYIGFAQDRYLVSLFMPQKFGTQYFCMNYFECNLYPFNLGTSNEERAKYEILNIEDRKNGWKY